MIAALYLASRVNFLLFHSFADMITIFIAVSVFVIIWSGRHLLDNHYYLCISTGFLFFAIFDFLHLLGSKGMGVFPQFGNLSPILYIFSRYILSITFLLAPFFIKRKVRFTVLFTVYSLISILLLLSVFYWKNFPVAFIEGTGLTPFKIISDYVIASLLLAAIGLLLHNRRAFDPRVMKYTLFSLILSIATGITFTLYSDPFDIMNTVGHFFQIASFYLVYRTFVETGLARPQNLLFRSLTQNNEERAAELVIANRELIIQAGEKADRAAELIIANAELIHQNEEKDKRAAELKKIEAYNIDLKQMVDEKVKEITESQTATIFALAKLAESRDNDTGDHLKRIQLYCRLIAEKLSIHSKYKDMITADFIDNLQKASPLHDIGKVGIRDAIPLKPGKLTPEEFEEMKQHASIGANTLKEVYQKYPGNYFVKIGIEIAQSHHEKWDGSGYPEGLCGDEIPLSARIMPLADVYDALRSKRVYKEAYSNEKTREIIVQGDGKHFDSAVVEAFLEYEQEFDKVYTLLDV